MTRKSINAVIRANDRSFVGKRLIFSHHIYGTTLGVIIAVTQDRVIYVTEEGKEEWSWIHPNGKDIGFSVLDDGKRDRDFMRAIRLEDAYRLLKKNYDEVCVKYDELKKYEKIAHTLRPLLDEEHYDGR